MKSSGTQESKQLLRVMTALKENLKLIVTWAIVGIIISLCVTFILITPKYSSTVDLLVNQKVNNTQAQFTAQQADLQAINTYKDILKKPIILRSVLSEAKKKDNYQGSIDDLSKAIEIKNQTNSQVISITVKDKNAYVAADLANLISKRFTSHIKKIMKIDNVTIVSKALPNKDKVTPKVPLNILVGLIVGFLVGSLIVILQELSNTKITESDFLTDELGLTLLGKVYHIENQNLHAVTILQDNSSVRKRRI